MVNSCQEVSEHNGVLSGLERKVSGNQVVSKVDTFNLRGKRCIVVTKE